MATRQDTNVLSFCETDFEVGETTPLQSNSAIGVRTLPERNATENGCPRSDNERENNNVNHLNHVASWCVVVALCYLVVLCHILLYRVQQVWGLSQSFTAESQLKVATSSLKIKNAPFGRGASKDSSQSEDTHKLDIDPVKILIVYGPTEDPWLKVMAEAIQKGCQSVSFATQVLVKTVASATFEDVLAADAILIGSSVENANTHPTVQQWLDEHWDIQQVDGSNMKVGAAFVTAGGISAGQEGTLNNLLKAMMIFRLVVVGGETWESAFGVAAITGEPPFMHYQDATGDSLAHAGFLQSCYMKQGEVVSPLFLERAKGLAVRVANVAYKIKA